MKIPVLLRMVMLLLTGWLLSGPPAQAATVDGSASIWTYFRDDSVDHTMVVPTLSLNVRQFAGDAWRFETTLRAFTDYRNGEPNDVQLRIFRGVLIYAPQHSPWDVRLGQQCLTEGVGRGNVAGPWVKRRFGQTSLTVYGGARLQNALSLDEKNANNGYAAGLHARTRIGVARLGASYFYLGRSGDLLFQGAGIEADGQPVKRLITRGRLDMNLAESSIENAQIVARWTPLDPLQVTGEFRVRQPRVFEDSYFKKFLEDVSKTWFRGGLAWTYHEHYVKVEGVTLFSENPDPIYKLRAALGDRNSEVGYTRWLTPDGGKMSGWYGEVHGDIGFQEKKVGELYGGLDFARGSNSEFREDTESQSIYLGFSVHPVQDLSISATAERLNDLDSRHEWRGLFSVGYRFGEYRREMR